MKKVICIRRIFERTLKGNAENTCCRSFISELFSNVYLPEFDLVCAKLFRRLKSCRGDRSLVMSVSDMEMLTRPVRDAFYAEPLKKMAPDEKKALRGLSGTLKQFADLLETYFETKE